MISFVRGTVAERGAGTVTIDVGGVGMTLYCTPSLAISLPEDEVVQVPTLLLVREDAFTLYGFASIDERRVFEQLLGANGVGPRVALSVMATLSPDQVRQAILAEDWATLTTVSGVGKKVAQRIVLELRSAMQTTPGLPPVMGEATSLSAAAEAGAHAHPPTSHAWRAQLTSALQGLGWGPREVEVALQEVSGLAETAVREGVQPDMQVLLRTALVSLNRSEVRAAQTGRHAAAEQQDSVESHPDGDAAVDVNTAVEVDA
jgi:Holliday junction DNA helicase RuvA